MEKILARKPSLSTVTSAISLGVLLLIIIPLLLTVESIITRGQFFTVFGQVLTDPHVWKVLSNTTIVIGTALLLALIAGVFLAWVVERTDTNLGWVSRILPIFPLMIPAFATTIGWIILAAPQAGYLNKAVMFINETIGITLPFMDIFSYPGLIALYAINMLPLVYLTVAAAMRNLDPSLEESSRISGYSVSQTFFKITLPLIKPAITSAALLAGIFGLSLFVVPRMIGTQANIDILTVEIVRLLVYTSPPQTDRSIVMSFFLIIMIGILWFISWRVGRNKRHAVVGGRAGGQAMVRLPGWAKFVLRTGISAFLIIFSVLPFAALIVVSLQSFWSGSLAGPYSLNSYREALSGSTQSSFALSNSLMLGMLGATIGMIVALFIAYRLQWYPNQLLSRFTDAGTKLPGALSHIVIAVGVLVAFAGPPVGLANTLTILMLCYLILYIPMATTSSQSALLQVGADMSEAAWISGDSPGRALRKITLPLAGPALISGWVFVFIMIVNDVTASAILSGPDSPVVGFMVLQLFENGTYPILAALAATISMISTITVVSVLFLSDWLIARRRKGGSKPKASVPDYQG